MDPRYHGAPGWDQSKNRSEASKRGAQLPTSSTRAGNLPGPPAPSQSYGSQPNSNQSGYGPSYSPGNPRGAVPAYPSGQYPAAYPQGQGAYAQQHGYGGYTGQPPSVPGSGPASPSRMSFAPRPAQPQQYVPQYDQQQYAQQYGQQHAQQYGQQAPFGQPPGAPGPSMASLMNPWSMLTSVSQMGNNVQASQQYVSSRVSWFTGGFFGNLFQIEPEYVRRKLVLLLAPYLRRYDYMRRAENMATAIPTMKPPRDDLFAPDLYIPLHAVFTYVVLSACNRFIGGSFKPDVMYNMFTWASMCWAVNFGFMFVLIRMMQLHAPPPALEIFSYAGYSFVGYCVSILFGWALGRSIGWYSAWFYTSCCMAMFLIRTFNQVIRVDAANRGRWMTYLLLAIGGAQFVVSWVMGATIHSPAVAKKVVDSTLPGT